MEWQSNSRTYRFRWNLCKCQESVFYQYSLFDIGQGNDYLYHGQNTFLGVHTGDCLKVTTKEQGAIIRKLPAEIFPEYFLIRVNEFNKVAVTPLEEWIEYLKTGTIRPDTTTPGLEEARQKLIYYNMNKADKLAYDRHLDALMIQMMY